MNATPLGSAHPKTGDGTATRILVTGATGFLGGHILEALRTRDGVEVIAAARTPENLPAGFNGEIRQGDLTDPEYRRSVVQGIDVVLHAGTWSSFWGHDAEEQELFLKPSIDLLDQAVTAGVKRFVSASTVALSTPVCRDERVDDDAPGVKRDIWPHLNYMIDVENHMRSIAGATQMTSMRLGHFIGTGNSLGLVSAIIPRLKTRQVPWVDHGRSHLPLISGEDMGEAFALAALADGLDDFESFNIIGNAQPTAREVFSYVAETAGVPKPAYSVPVGAAYGFAALMEGVHRFTRAKAPFLTNALVHVGENWHATSAKATTKLGFTAQSDWRETVATNVEDLRSQGFPWPELAQSTTRVTEPAAASSVLTA